MTSLYRNLSTTCGQDLTKITFNTLSLLDWFKTDQGKTVKIENLQYIIFNFT